jgi:hypothetical protein
MTTAAVRQRRRVARGVLMIPNRYPATRPGEPPHWSESRYVTVILIRIPSA